MKLLSDTKKGVIYTIMAGLFYGPIGYFGMNILNANYSINNMLFWRFLIASLFLSVLLAPNANSIADSIKEKLKVFFYGVVFYATGSILYFVASKYIGTGLAMVIFFTYPSMVMILNWLIYRTAISKIYYLSASLIMFGMVLLVDIGEVAFDLFGIGIGLLSAFLYAAYIISSKDSKLPPMSSTLIISIACTLTCGAIALSDGSFALPLEFDIWLNIMGIAIICTALPILYFLKGVQYINTSKASILGVLEPVIVVIFGVVLLGEKLNFVQAIGAIIILFGAICSLLDKELLNKVTTFFSKRIKAKDFS